MNSGENPLEGWKPDEQFKEVVLKSGRFAKLRKPVWLDMVMSYNPTNPLLITTAVIARCCTVDDKTLTVEQWCQMDIDEIHPILVLLGSYIQTAQNLGRGAV